MNITTAYMSLGLDSSKEYFVQNTSSTEIELYIGPTTPSANAEGFVLAPHKGFYIKLDDGHQAYAKTEGFSGVGRLVISP